MVRKGDMQNFVLKWDNFQPWMAKSSITYGVMTIFDDQ